MTDASASRADQWSILCCFSPIFAWCMGEECILLYSSSNVKQRFTIMHLWSNFNELLPQIRYRCHSPVYLHSTCSPFHTYPSSLGGRVPDVCKCPVLKTKKMNKKIYTWRIKTSTQNLACSQRQIPIVHACRLSQTSK